jgi:short-subunit dehydrogenase
MKRSEPCKTSSLRKPKVFLTGASSGIGRALASHLMSEGYEVWGTSRDLTRLEISPNFHPVALDFSVSGSVEAAWRQVLEEAGGIDMVIQNAGSGIFGSVEEIGAEEAQRQWRILVEGPLILLKLAAAHLRPKGQGWIIGISSLAAEMPMPFFGHYSAGKAALSALLANLWMELRPFGVHVVDFRPGDIRTAFNDSVSSPSLIGSAYGSWAAGMWEESCRLLAAAPEPDHVARDLVRLLKRKKPPAVWRSGSFFQTVVGTLGVRLLSRSALLKSIRQYYRLDRADQGSGK